MLYAIICHDKPDHVEMRMQTRPEHLSYLRALGYRLKFAGPFTNDNGAPNGSLVVIDAEDRAQAQAIAAGDPYARRGLFASCAVHAWSWTVNNPDSK